MAAPINVAPPVITLSTNLNGAPIAGSTVISISTGSWTGNPTSFEYLWKRTNLTEVGNGFNNEEEYSCVDSDIGQYIYGQVTAINEDGTSTTVTGSVGPVVGKPVCVSGPTISPTSGGLSAETIDADGEVVIEAIGTVFSVNTNWYIPTSIGASNLWPEIMYGWHTTSTTPDNADPFVGGNSPSYTCGSSDIGKKLYCNISCQNGWGTTVVQSGMTGVLVKADPVLLLGGFLPNPDVTGIPLSGGYYLPTGPNPPALPTSPPITQPPTILPSDIPNP